MPIWEMMAHFIRNMGDEVQFYWQFEKGGTSLLDRFIGGWQIFLFISKTILAVGWSFVSWSKL